MNTTFKFLFLFLTLGINMPMFPFDYMVESLSSIVKRSNEIVEVEVIEIKRSLDEHNSPIDIVKVRVNDLIYGKTIEPFITFYIPISDYVSSTRSLSPKFYLGERAILHLKKNEEMTYFIIGHDQGKFEITGNTIEKSNVSVTEFKQQIKNVAQGKSNFIIESLHRSKSNGEVLDSSGEGILKFNGEFHLLDPIRYGPTSGTIQFRINPANAKDKDGNQISFNEVKSAIQRAVDAWNNVNHSSITFSIYSTEISTNRIQGDGISTITFETDGTGSNGRTWTLPSGGVINEVDMSFNAYNRWNTNSTYPSTYSTYTHPVWGSIGPVDLEDVAAHELGHGVGLHHVGDSYSSYTLCPTNYYASSWWEKTWRRSLEVGDKAGKIYLDPSFTGATTQSYSKMLLSVQSITVFNGSFTIPAGYYLEVESGKAVQFNSGSSLLVNGTLNAYNATFNFVTPSASNGIKFNSGSSGSMLDYCAIKYANRGIECNGVLPSIRNSTFDNNTSGIWLNNIGTTTTQIYNNVIQNCASGHGIYCYNSSPLLNQNTLDHNNNGLFCLGSSPYIYGNNIKNNITGLFLVNNSQPKIYAYPTGSGFNRIISNDVGIHAESPVNISMSGNDFFYVMNYAVTASNSAIVQGQDSYWGQFPPPASYFSATTGAQIFYLPGRASYYTYPAKEAVFDDQLITENDPADFVFSQALLDASKLMAEAKYNEAITVLRSEFGKDKDFFKRRYILIQLAECYRSSGKNDFSDFIKNFVKPDLSANDDLYATILETENLFLMQDNQYDKAISNLEIIRSHFAKHSYTEKSALFNLGYIYTELLKDRPKGDKYFDELKSKYPNDYLTMNAMFILGEIDSLPAPGIPLKKNLNAIEAPKEFSLSDNYPNPFNPSTVIKYSLPVQSHVTLKVYDILGAEVASLVDDVKAAGVYEISFNAGNLSSGVYVYQLRTNDFVQTRKMNLLK